MERIFEAQNAGYGQMILGVARATKKKVSGVFTALKLPRFLVSVLTWGILISLGLMLAGLIAFVALIYFALTRKSDSADVVSADNVYCPWEDPTSMEYQQWTRENEECWEVNHGSKF